MNHYAKQLNIIMTTMRNKIKPDIAEGQYRFVEEKVYVMQYAYYEH